MTLSDSISTYLRTLAHDERNDAGDVIRRNRTAETYHTGIAKFTSWLSERLGREIALTDIGTNDPADFADSLKETHAAYLTRRTYCAAVMGFLRYAYDHDWLSPNFDIIKAGIRLKRVNRKATYPVKKIEDALPRILTYYENKAKVLPPATDEPSKRKRLAILRNRAFAWTLFTTAARLGEIATLDRQTVMDGNADEGILEHGKGDKDRYIFLPHAEARKAIREYLAERGDTLPALFLTHAKNRHGTRLGIQAAANIVKDAAQTLGMDVSPHDFRHYRARGMLDEGVPLDVIQAMLGHADIATTRKVYAVSNKRTIKEWVKNLAPVVPG